jgi:hypothetical protein
MDYTGRSLPGPGGCRLSDGDQTPEALFELLQDWQRAQTQSSATAFAGPGQRMDVRFCGEQAPTGESTDASCQFRHKRSALSRSRVRRTVFSP